MKLGLDFDNTLISYDRLLPEVVVELGYLPAGHGLEGKTAIRDALRAQGTDGDLRWQQVQAHLYSDGVRRAEMPAGLEALFDFVRNHGIETWIVSHKTRTASFDPQQREFRTPALQWMEQHGFFDPKRFGLPRERVVFADTLEHKLSTIAELNFTHFVDDLEEVLGHRLFPRQKTKAWLYSKQHHGTNGCAVWQDWEDIANQLAQDHADERLASTLAELEGDVIAATPVRGGRNSRCYRVQAKTDVRALFVKQYFRSATDPRNRLETEYGAIQLMHRGGLQCVPHPIMRHAASHSAIYQFVDGAPALQGPLNVGDVDQLLAFVSQLQSLRSSSDAATVRPASEAYFCFDDIVRNLRARRARLSGVPHDALQAFLGDIFDPLLEVTVFRVARGLMELGTDPAALLPEAQRILSPSDIGFHNALRVSGGELVFIDFEYFGWDDPAKLISDFVLQPEVQLDRALLDRFRDGVFRLVGDVTLPDRYRLYVQLFRLKWVLILLNEYLRDDRSRRQLAGVDGTDWPAVLARQLEKARKMIQPLGLQVDEENALPAIHVGGRSHTT